jgi:hypothetical protein
MALSGNPLERLEQKPWFEAIGCVFADHAAVALANAQTHAATRLEVAQLEETLGRGECRRTLHL